jgi:hypothetical protein
VDPHVPKPHLQVNFKGRVVSNGLFTKIGLFTKFALLKVQLSQSLLLSTQY